MRSAGAQELRSSERKTFQGSTGEEEKRRRGEEMMRSIACRSFTCPVLRERRQDCLNAKKQREAKKKRREDRDSR